MRPTLLRQMDGEQDWRSELINRHRLSPDCFPWAFLFFGLSGRGHSPDDGDETQTEARDDDALRV